MKEYIAPAYEIQAVETTDIMTPSAIKDEGTGTLGHISGNKGSFALDFDSVFH